MDGVEDMGHKAGFLLLRFFKILQGRPKNWGKLMSVNTFFLSRLLRYMDPGIRGS